MDGGSVGSRAGTQAVGPFEELKAIFKLNKDLCTAINNATGNQPLWKLNPSEDIQKALTISVVLIDNMAHLARHSNQQKESKELHWSFYDTAAGIMEYCIAAGWPSHPKIGPIWRKYKIQTVENFVAFMAREEKLVVNHCGGLIRTFGRGKVF